MLDDYLTDLEYSSLALPLWGIALLWLVAFVFSHILFRKTRKLLEQQALVKLEGMAALGRASSPGIIGARIGMATAIFAVSNYIGGYSVPLYAGGWLLTTCASLVVNLQGYLYVRAMTRQSAAAGSLTITKALVYRENAFSFFAFATFCLVAGLLLPHLALLGGALFIGATAFGYLRRARKADAAPAAGN
ncbi:MAG: hypothetical protein JWN73_3600 [Betaproteobacteria bacterium]|nr:hypothetical protein [Betaproteobacteria bacterium]